MLVRCLWVLGLWAACGVVEDDSPAPSGAGEGGEDEDAPDDPLEEIPCRPPSQEGPLSCSPLWGCLLSNPPDCRARMCPAAEGADARVQSFSDCLGERCVAMDPEEQQACAEERCRAPLLECIAHGDDETCWSFEACVESDCLPLQATEGDEAVGACVDRCLEEEATPRCRQCRSEAYEGFMEARCGDPLLVWQRCARANGCEDARCATERCPDEAEELQACVDAALAGEGGAADLSDRLDPCYAQGAS